MDELSGAVLTVSRSVVQLCSLFSFQELWFGLVFRSGLEKVLFCKNLVSLEILSLQAVTATGIMFVSREASLQVIDSSLGLHAIASQRSQVKSGLISLRMWKLFRKVPCFC